MADFWFVPYNTITFVARENICMIVRMNLDCAGGGDVAAADAEIVQHQSGNSSRAGGHSGGEEGGYGKKADANGTMVRRVP
jgi:hypothetical protein